MKTWQPQSHDASLYKRFIKTWLHGRKESGLESSQCGSSQCQGLGNKELPGTKILK